MRRRIRRLRLESEHPLVRVHPETGEKVLFVSPGFLKSIVGLAPRESEALLELLWEHVVRPEFTVRFRWEAGSIAFWDNRATAHLAPRDIFDTEFERQFYRVTLAGDVRGGSTGANLRASKALRSRHSDPRPPRWCAGEKARHPPRHRSGATGEGMPRRIRRRRCHGRWSEACVRLRWNGSGLVEGAHGAGAGHGAESIRCARRSVGGTPPRHREPTFLNVRAEHALSVG